MQVQRIHSNYYNSYNQSLNVNRSQSVSNINNISFQCRQPLVQLTCENVVSVHAPILKRFFKFYNMLGESGCIEDMKLFSETIQPNHYDLLSSKEKIVDIYLTIQKNINDAGNTIIKFYEKAQKGDKPVFEATLNKDGQMFSGYFLAGGHKFRFQREIQNKKAAPPQSFRRIRDDYSGNNYVQSKTNDLAWTCPNSSTDISSSTVGKDLEKSCGKNVAAIFDLFLNLARINTRL